MTDGSTVVESGTPHSHPGKRIAIFVIAYDAVETLAKTLDRIPPDVMRIVEEIFVIDDCSSDNTYDAALGYKHARNPEKLRVFRNPVNLRYGGNQKRGYEYALERAFDVVVLLHADGQYAPESLPLLLEPLLRDEADMVFGSRMAEGGKPLQGGMPFYKYAGNRILTFLQNRLLGMSLTEFHSGYRLYSCHALRRLPLHLNSNEWHFDTEILIQFREAGFRIAELPIPTYYGDEICHVNGIAYAFNVLRTSVRYLLHRKGWIRDPRFDVDGTHRYELKSDPWSSHSRVIDLARRCRPERVLEVGTAQGYISRVLAGEGCRIVGIERDTGLAREAAAHCKRMVVGDVDSLDLSDLGQFDLLLCADVLEHLPRPTETLRRLTLHIRPGGHAIVSLPNIALWYFRLRLLFGRFTYMRKGPMDSSHLRFFTRSSAVRMMDATGLRVVEVISTPLPLPTVFPAFGRSRVLSALHRLNAWVTRLWPALLAYQFVILAEKGGSDR